MTSILGVSAFYHDSAAALVVDGRIVAAAQEERFSRRKNDHEFPVRAIEYCLREAGLRPEQLDYVGFYDKPFLKFDRLLETYLSFAPAGLRSFAQAMPLWLKQKLHLPREMRRALGGAYRKRFVFSDHHESHAASAFFPSPFEEAAILTLDGVGEWATATAGTGRGNRVSLDFEQRFPHSLGLLYSAFTYWCGFAVNSGEYKLMGLAPYGEPRFVDLILEKLIDLKPDGSFRLDLSYFRYCQGLTMTGRKFDRLFGAPPRRKDTHIEPLYMDVAASIQKVCEEIVLRSARWLHERTKMKNLCLAGGVALNCVGNGRILREGPFERIWIQPAAGDAGGALGVALLIWHQLLGHARTPRPSDDMQGSLLGPAFDERRIREFLDGTGAPYEHVPDPSALSDRIARAIAAGKVIGWFQGRMEFGPRALGSRSILGDARDPLMQTTMNVKVKFREGFRPFAPAVLRDHAHEWFDVRPGEEGPYMLVVAPVRETRRIPQPPGAGESRGIEKLRQVRSSIAAVTHVDYSARLQTVDAERHGPYEQVIRRFHELTGCPVVVNTSFNLGWEPIVCTPEEAFRTFMSCEIDVLCLGSYVLEKARQPAHAVAAEPAGADPVLDRLWTSPCHRAELRPEGGRAVCAECGHAFEREDGVWKLFWPHDAHDRPGDVTQTVRSFYEENPFPNYDDHDSLRSLIEKARQGQYAAALDASIPYNSRVLEVGCGTGQLSNFLGIACRQVVGADLCLNSLRMGERFRSTHGLSRVRFVQMNLFRPCLRPESFDVLLCNGVLHHTADPFGGFRGLLPLVKPGGHVIVGLYSRFGRLFTDLRRALFRITGGRARWVDPILRSGRLGRAQREAWFADQYRHPHESEHTVDEVLDWFAGTDVEFVRGIPSVTPRGEFPGSGNLFAPEDRGTRLERLLTQLGQVVTASKEGGFFLMVGRKRAGAVPEPARRREQAVHA